MGEYVQNLGIKSEPSARGFRIGQDAIDRAHHVAEDTNGWSIAQNVDALDRYVKGDACLVLHAQFARNSRYCDLVLVRIPTGVGGGEAPGKAVDIATNSDLTP